jgi:hypothetical protein
MLPSWSEVPFTVNFPETKQMQSCDEASESGSALDEFQAEPMPALHAHRARRAFETAQLQFELIDAKRRMDILRDVESRYGIINKAS